MLSQSVIQLGFYHVPHVGFKHTHRGHVRMCCSDVRKKEQTMSGSVPKNVYLVLERTTQTNEEAQSCAGTAVSPNRDREIFDVSYHVDGVIVYDSEDRLCI